MDNVDKKNPTVDDLFEGGALQHARLLGTESAQ